MVTNPWVAGLTTVLLLVTCSTAGADSLDEQKRLEAVQLIQRNLESLEGHVRLHDQKFQENESHDRLQDQKIQEIATTLAKHDEFFAILKPLADINRRTDGNQQEAFLQQLVALLCQEKNCELARRIEALERQFDLLEPTPAPIEPTFADPTPVPIPPLRQWNGPFLHIVDRRESFCPTATLIARCIDYPLTDGTVRHGDVFWTCQGNYVLLLHQPRYRSLLAGQ